MSTQLERDIADALGGDTAAHGPALVGAIGHMRSVFADVKSMLDVTNDDEIVLALDEALTRASLAEVVCVAAEELRAAQRAYDAGRMNAAIVRLDAALSARKAGPQ